MKRRLCLLCVLACALLVLGHGALAERAVGSEAELRAALEARETDIELTSDMALAGTVILDYAVYIDGGGYAITLPGEGPAIRLTHADAMVSGCAFSGQGVAIVMDIGDGGESDPFGVSKSNGNCVVQSADAGITVRGQVYLVDEGDRNATLAGAIEAGSTARSPTLQLSADSAIGAPVTVPGGCTLEVPGGRTLTLKSAMTVEGTVTVAGSLIVERGATLAISGQGAVTVDGLLKSAGTVTGTVGGANNTPWYPLTINGAATIEPEDAHEGGWVKGGSQITLTATGANFDGWQLPDRLEVTYAPGNDRAITFVMNGPYELTIKQTPPIVPPPIAPPPIEPLTLDRSSLTLSLGETATLVPSEPTTWHSSNEAVATVDADGVVTGVGMGDATITATAPDGRSSSCAVTVEEADWQTEAIGLGIETLAVRKGKRLVLPEFQGYRGTWTSADPSIAVIAKKGTQVKALDYGTTSLVYEVEAEPKRALVIGGRALKAGDRYMVTLQVRGAGELVKKVSLSPKKATLDTLQDKTVQLVASVSPGTAADRSLYYESSDRRVAEVDASGRVTAIGPGKCKITATSTNLKRASVTITVRGAIAVRPAKKTIRVGKELPLTATVAPGMDGEITWSSSKPDVATVDEVGRVTAHQKGKATITATAPNGDTASAVITVRK